MKVLNESLKSMMSPKKIAIIGASGNEKKIGYKSVSNLRDIGYEGEVYLVNPKYDEIAGFPCYASIEDLPQNIDLALISLSASFVLDTLEKLNNQHVKSAIILSSGYAEIGEEGKKLEDKITNFSKATGMKICGPNTIGIANFKEKSLASFSSLKPTKVDPIAFVTQSGALGTLTYMMSKEMGVGFHYFVASGNEAATDFFEYVNYFSKQEDIKVIGGYIEGARDYEKLNEAIQSCQQNDKPLVLMKVGSSERGAEAATSHTASVAGNATIYNNYFKQKNVVQVKSEEELVDTLAVFSKTNTPQEEKGIALVTQSGGTGIIMTDICEKNDIDLAAISDETRQALKENLPAFSSLSNPIDITAQVAQQPDQILKALDITLQDDDVSTVVLYLQMTDDKFLPILDELESIVENTDKRVVFCWSGILSETKERLLSHENICWIPNPTRAINALTHVINYNKNKTLIDRPNEINTKQRNSLNLKIAGNLNEVEGKQLLKQYNISIPNGKLITDVNDVKQLKMKKPWVMKAVSKEVQHKSDYNLVNIGIDSTERAIDSYREIENNFYKHFPNYHLEGILVEEMVDEGIEVIIGTINDPTFGQCVVFGLGGIYVEILKDVVILPAPLSYNEAKKMVESIQNYKLLSGVRGKKYDVEAVIDAVVKVSNYCADNKDDLIETDINPVIVHEEGKGVTAVDALIVSK